MSAHPTDIDRSLSILDKLAAEQLQRANGATESSGQESSGYSPESLPSEPPPVSLDTPLKPTPTTSAASTPSRTRCRSG